MPNSMRMITRGISSSEVGFNKSPNIVSSNDDDTVFETFVDESSYELIGSILGDKEKGQNSPLYLTTEGTDLALRLESLDDNGDIVLSMNGKSGQVSKNNYEDIESFCSALLEDFEPNTSFFTLLREIPKDGSISLCDGEYTSSFPAESVLMETYNQAFFEEYTIPSYYNSYLFNDDQSSLTDEEIHILDTFIAKILEENPDYDCFYPSGSIDKGELSKNDVTGNVYGDCTLILFKVKEEKDSLPDEKTEKKQKKSRSVKL